ncbi:protein of unknown function (plasmid) [Shinella sp. WSC3-e]|nr:hypothetical protein SHINE37_60025 [Rhizobiaceae bacterium]CAK7262099.1 protein of unknown function [Shinella sp. WSC3-e]
MASLDGGAESEQPTTVSTRRNGTGVWQVVEGSAFELRAVRDDSNVNNGERYRFWVIVVGDGVIPT